MRGTKSETPTGRIDKRQAILTAAVTVFARDGYHLAGVDAIAAEAEVAKHTIYNHFGDKEKLFREVIAHLSDQALTRNLAAVELLGGPGDLTDLLTATGTRLAECYCAPESEALRRLLRTTTLPDLLDIVRDRATDRVYDALAARLARLAHSGQLTLQDPAVAAEHFGALLTGPLELRSHMGARKIPTPELREVTANAVTTFLRAFGTAPTADQAGAAQAGRDDSIGLPVSRQAVTPPARL